MNTEQILRLNTFEMMECKLMQYKQTLIPTFCMNSFHPNIESHDVRFTGVNVV